MVSEKAVAMGRLMADTVTIVKPDTILRWHRRLVAKKFNGSKFRKRHGRPPVSPEVEKLIVIFVEENSPRDTLKLWVYLRIPDILSAKQD